MSKKTGFTIIEVVLFLAISAVMAVSILAGASSSIESQQYRESVRSFQSFLNGQFDMVINVQNNRLDGSSCPLESSSRRLPRGQSRCVILGRLIMARDYQGNTYDTYPIYALERDSQWHYTLGKVESSYEMKWGTQSRLSTQRTDNVRLSILMYRDPDNSKIVFRTTNNNYNANNIGDFFLGLSSHGDTGDNQLQSRELCVFSDRWLVGERLSVLLGQNSGSSSGIMIENATDRCRRD